MSAKDVFHESVKHALQKDLNYRLALKVLEPDRFLYLAVPLSAYDSFFCRSLPQASVAEYQLKLLVYDPVKEVIVLWID